MGVDKTDLNEVCPNRINFPEDSLFVAKDLFINDDLSTVLPTLMPSLDPSISPSKVPTYVPQLDPTRKPSTYSTKPSSIPS